MPWKKTIIQLTFDKSQNNQDPGKGGNEGGSYDYYLCSNYLITKTKKIHTKIFNKKIEI